MCGLLGLSNNQGERGISFSGIHFDERAHKLYVLYKDQVRNISSASYKGGIVLLRDLIHTRPNLSGSSKYSTIPRVVKKLNMSKLSMGI